MSKMCSGLTLDVQDVLWFNTRCRGLACRWEDSGSLSHSRLGLATTRIRDPYGRRRTRPPTRPGNPRRAFATHGRLFYAALDRCKVRGRLCSALLCSTSTVSPLPLALAPRCALPSGTLEPDSASLSERRHRESRIEVRTRRVPVRASAPAPPSRAFPAAERVLTLPARCASPKELVLSPPAAAQSCKRSSRDVPLLRRQPEVASREDGLGASSGHGRLFRQQSKLQSPRLSPSLSLPPPFALPSHAGRVSPSRTRPATLRQVSRKP